MSNPVTFPRGCPVCRGTVAFDASTATYRCQNEGCDYSRRTLHPDPRDLVVKMTGQGAEPAKPAPANIAAPAPITVEAAANMEDFYTLAELIERWGVTDATARKRLVKYGGQETVASYRPIPRAVVEKIEREVASWGMGGEPQESTTILSADSVSVVPLATEGPTPVELGKRWGISTHGAQQRLQYHGGIPYPSATQRISREAIESVEAHFAKSNWGRGKMSPRSATPAESRAVAAADSNAPHRTIEKVRTLTAEDLGIPTEAAPVPTERALVVAEKPAAPPTDHERRITRLRLTLTRIADIAGKKDPLVAELARLALDLDAVEG